MTIQTIDLILLTLMYSFFFSFIMGLLMHAMNLEPNKKGHNVITFTFIYLTTILIFLGSLAMVIELFKYLSII